MRVLVIGAGEVGTAVTIYLSRLQITAFCLELDHPTSLKRMKSFCQAVFVGGFEVEGVTARRVTTLEQLNKALVDNIIPVLTSSSKFLSDIQYDIVVNTAPTQFKFQGVTISTNWGIEGLTASIVIQKSGCYAGTRQKQQKMSEPELIGGYSFEREARAEIGGRWTAKRGIGEFVKIGDPIGVIESDEGGLQTESGECLNRKMDAVTHRRGQLSVCAPVSGLLLGLLETGAVVLKNQLLCEIDPLCDAAFVYTLSTRARCVAGSVICELMAWQSIRDRAI
ncbi:Selenium-dependent molybdenum hydroxylase system protein, YqeB family [Spironucleus salmonicida]|uniref:Selenium-dependent molybdenum hydroxylase system protein, YqeB family n=1 Tax=Spironucleus salmonicida TaxID=348837 RepID=A0A9P8LMR3_9EUKA|nr:Selenium-dependent molybdenum hydroxylase system protein, YqeB family [Spironucleus salmonicida]